MASLRRLNPNAQEFVPSGMRPGSGSGSGSSSNNNNGSGSSGRDGVELNRFESGAVEPVAKAAAAPAVEASSDDDLYQQYWLSQLPENLISDFDVQSKVFDDGGRFGLEEQRQQQQQVAVGFEAAPQSLAHGGSYRQRDSASSSSALATDFQEGGISGNLYLGGDVLEQLQAQADYAYASSPSEARAGWAEDSDLNWGYNFRGAGGVAFPDELVDIDPVALLTTRFPGFAVKSLTELLYANGGDLSLTVEMLQQLEMQDEGSVSEQYQSVAHVPSVSTPADFPALAGYDLGSRDVGSGGNMYSLLEGEMRKLSTSDDYRSSSTNFAAVARKGWSGSAKAAAADSYQGLGRSFARTSQVDSFFGASRLEDKLQQQQHKFQLSSKAQRHTPKPWLNTGEAVSNLYADMREEARDHARARNVCFEQARQAYIAGNRALAKELSSKGHQLNEQMKAAHDKAGKAIFHERNAAIAGEFQKLTQGKARLLDLHGLHVKEAVVLLKQELKSLRLAAALQRSKQQMFVCVGTGHHTPGARALARLPIAIKQYLATEELDLQFTETEPGMLLVTL